MVERRRQVCKEHKPVGVMGYSIGRGADGREPEEAPVPGQAEWGEKDYYK